MNDSDDSFADLFNRANVLVMELGRPEEALPFLHRALAIEPEDWKTLTLAMFAYLDCARNSRRAGQMRQMSRNLLRGVRYYFAAIRANPDSEMAHVLRLSAFSIFRAHKRALKAAQEAIKYDPENPLLLQKLGTSLVACRRYVEAEEAALKAREIDPEEVGSHLLLARIKMAQKQWQAAETHYMDALALDAIHTETLYYLGVTLWWQNRRPEAIERFYEALKLDPNSNDYRTTHSQAVRRYLLPAWAGKVFVRFLVILTLVWTAFLYGAVRSLGMHPWLAAIFIFYVGGMTGHRFFTYPQLYLSSYKRRLAEEHPPSIAIALKSEGGTTSLPDEPNCLAHIAWNFLLITLLSLYGAPLIHFWTRLAEIAGLTTPIWLFVVLSLGVWLFFIPSSSTDEEVANAKTESSEEEPSPSSASTSSEATRPIIPPLPPIVPPSPGETALPPHSQDRRGETSDD